MLRDSARRYLVVGIGNTLLDLALFTLLAVGLGVTPVLANVGSTAVVVTLSFFLNRSWVFRAEDAGLRAYVGFVAVTLFSALVLQSLVILGVIAAADELAPSVGDGLVEPGAKLCAMAVGMVSNFLGYRWVFGGGSSTASSSSTTAKP